MNILHLKNFPIFRQLQIEEALLRLDKRNFCIINEGSPPAIVMGISGKPDELIDKTRLAQNPIPVIKRFSIQPEEFGIRRTPIDSITAVDAADSLRIIRSVLDNQEGPARDIVQLNAGAAIYTAGLADSLAAGVEKADAAIASGEARNRLDRLAILTQSFD